MLPELTKYMLTNWNRFFPVTRKPNNIDFLGIPGSVDGGTTTFLAFGDQMKTPLFVIKVHRHEDVYERVTNEVKVLNYLATCDDDISNTVPRLIISKKISGVWVLVQSILKGKPMDVIINKKGTPKLKYSEKNFRLITTWLEKLSLTSRSVDDSLCNRHSQYFKETIDNFTFLFGLSAKELYLRDFIIERISSIIEEGLCIQHGDFCRQNLLVFSPLIRTRFSVIDWTDCKRFGLPLHDLFFFFTTYFFQVRRGTLKKITESFESTFFEDNSYSKLVKYYIAKHCEALSVERSNLSARFGLFLIERAIAEYQRLLKCSNNDVLPRFTINLALSERTDFKEALKKQLWIRYFRAYADKRELFEKGL